MCEHTRLGRLHLQKERQCVIGNSSTDPRTPTQVLRMDSLVCFSSLVCAACPLTEGIQGDAYFISDPSRTARRQYIYSLIFFVYVTHLDRISPGALTASDR